ncbi:LPS export ABC transporter permease LptF [Reinekea marina]|uniref:Lipopolysaccharide export system permease protein LptF n=1 Tax=Reinekea marina TaxID=1310421 RepID=A0ABV7WUE8_9GAMM|nr:LPS export ABC transporter permease LptF [Reinekea marina]MDN3649325.1 LPS export ABC transporter permease LptF [Reinekea marina]
MTSRMVLAKYISKQVLMPTAAVTSVALLLFTSTRFVRILEDTNGTELFSDLLYILVLSVPSYFVEVLPLGLFLGVLLGIGQMYAEHEMTAILSTGIPFTRIRNTLLFLGFVGCVMLWGITLFIAPSTSKVALEHQREISNRNPFDLLKAGEFNQLGSSDDVFYLENAQTTGNPIENIFMAQPSKGIFIWSDSGELININGQRYFKLENGTLLEGIFDSTQSNYTTFQRYAFLLPEVGEKRYRLQSATMTNRELIESKRQWELTEFLYRIGYPPIMIVMAMLGLSFAKTNPREGKFKMLLPALLCYSFYTLMLSASIRPVYRGEASFFQVYWWVHLLFLFIAFAIHYAGYWKFRNKVVKGSRS